MPTNADFVTQSAEGFVAGGSVDAVGGLTAKTSDRHDGGWCCYCSWTPRVGSDSVNRSRGIVKLSRIGLADPQHPGSRRGSSPSSWGPVSRVSVNLTVSIIPLPAEVAR